MSLKERPHTPDGRYFVVRNVLQRCTDPRLDSSERRAHIKALMQARRAAIPPIRDEDARVARDRVEAAKRALGEAGPVWWDDGAPDESGMPPYASSYARWWAGLSEAEREAGD